MTEPRAGHQGSVLRGDIEGLRAIAVMMVLLYHAHLPGLAGGFAGVDVFFVISGYLITGQLVKEVNRRGSVSIPSFYARRARRLLPAATVVLVCTLILGWLLLPRNRWAELAGDVTAATLYVVNWALAFRSVDYLAEDSQPSLVQHYWSLSVEEQFYVVWPLLVIAGAWLARRLGRRPQTFLAAALAVTVVASFVWSVVHTASSPRTAYFVTTTRVWELGIGAGLVFLTPWLTRLPRVLATPMAAVGLLLVGLTLVTVDGSTPWPGSAALLPTVGTALVIAGGLVHLGNAVGRILGVAPMRFLGGLSYGLYLWHWPLLQLLDIRRPDASLLLRFLVAGLAVLLAWATLHLVENPIRFDQRLSSSTSRALLWGAGAMAVSLVAAQTLNLQAPRLTTAIPDSTRGALALVRTTEGGGVERDADGRPVPVADPAAAYTTSGRLYPDPAVAPEDVPAAYADGCQVAQSSVTLPREDECWFGDPSREKVVAVVGDSKMLQWMPALIPIAEQEGWSLKVWTKSACGFGAEKDYPECGNYNDRLREKLLEDPPALVLTSLGGTMVEGSLEVNLRPLVDASVPVVLVDDNTFRPSGVDYDETTYECLLSHPDDYLACAFEAPGAEGWGTPILKAAADELDVPLVSVNRWLCPTPDRCPAAIGGMTLYRQGAHVSATYVRSLTPFLHDELVRAGVATTRAGAIAWEIAPAEGTSAP